MNQKYRLLCSEHAFHQLNSTLSSMLSSLNDPDDFVVLTQFDDCCEDSSVKKSSVSDMPQLAVDENSLTEPRNDACPNKPWRIGHKMQVIK